MKIIQPQQNYTIILDKEAKVKKLAAKIKYPDCRYGEKLIEIQKNGTFMKHEDDIRGFGSSFD